MHRLRLILGLMACVAADAAGAGGFELMSADLASGQSIARTFVLDDHGCGGDNRSPALHWSDGPADTQAYAITAHDPDAPSSGGWWHWIAYAIPARVHALARGASGELPAESAESVNDFGFRGYGGPCPPAGDSPHRYVFTVYALDTDALKPPDDASPAARAALIERHALAQARLVARYGR